jgi:hypothetical protein
MDLTSRLTQSQIEYHSETDNLSTTGSLNNSDIFDTSVSCTSKTVTQMPVHPASEQTGIFIFIVFCCNRSFSLQKYYGI